MWGNVCMLYVYVVHSNVVHNIAICIYAMGRHVVVYRYNIWIQCMMAGSNRCMVCKGCFFYSSLSEIFSLYGKRLYDTAAKLYWYEFLHTTRTQTLHHCYVESQCEQRRLHRFQVVYCSQSEDKWPNRGGLLSHVLHGLWN